MKLPNIVALLAAIAGLVLLALLIRARNDLMLAQAAVASLKNANADLTVRVAEMERNKLDDALVKRLLADQREAIKLRGEITTLKKSLATAESAAAAANAAAQRLNSDEPASKSAIAEASPENPYTRVFTNQAHAILPAGHGMILGGWQTAPGKQGLAVAIPTTNENNPGAIMVSARFLELSDDAASKLNSITPLSAAGVNYHGILTPDQLAAFLKTAEQTPGVDVLGSPRVMVGSGREARVSVTREGQTPNGPVTLGPSMSLTPTLGADGSIDLVVDAKLTLPTDPPTAAANQ